MKISEIIFSWDSYIAIILTVITFAILPNILDVSFCITVYTIGVSVLSIIFSLFFASLAIIMTSSSDDFILFLDEKGDFKALLNSFRITLIMLFISLLYTISLYVYSNYQKIQKQECNQTLYLFLIFIFLSIYSLISTALSINDSIIFSKIRAKFLREFNSGKPRCPKPPTSDH